MQQPLSPQMLPHRWRTFAILMCAVVFLSGCRGRERRARMEESDKPRAPREVSAVRCLFDARPWLNLDKSGDRDPEGIHFRVFLDTGSGKGTFRDGELHIELYRVEQQQGTPERRTLMSDWHYKTTEFPRVTSTILGQGYHVHLRWGSKEIAGKDIEIITQFEDTHGNVTRSATKVFRVPKYSS